MSESPVGDDANRLGRVWLKEVSEYRAVVLVTTLTLVYASESAGEGVAGSGARLSCSDVGHAIVYVWNQLGWVWLKEVSECRAVEFLHTAIFTVLSGYSRDALSADVSHGVRDMHRPGVS